MTKTPQNEDIETEKTPQFRSKQKETFYYRFKDLIEEFGEWEINLLQLSRDWKVPVSTLHRWKEEILKEIGPLDISKFGRNLQFAGTANLKLAQRMIREAKDPATKLRGIDTFFKAVDSMTEFLEKYGYKIKIPDQIQVQEVDKEVSLLEAYKEFQKKEAMNAKRRGTNNQ